jgi:hypothetical protein
MRRLLPLLLCPAGVQSAGFFPVAVVALDASPTSICEVFFLITVKDLGATPD